MTKTKTDVGLEAGMPERSCTSDKCPWHGTLRIRGRVFEGIVVSSKGMDTAVVMWSYYNYVPKYERYERRKTKVSAHNPKCISAKTGSMVRIGECRPVSKSKKFVVFEVVKQ